MAFGRTVSNLIENALSTGAEVSLETEETPQGQMCVMTVPGKAKGQVYKLWLDPEKLYYAWKVERYHEGRLVTRATTTPQLVAEDIWFPMQGRRQSFWYEEGEREIRQDTTMEVKDVKVNIEVLAPETFEVKLLRGDLVADMRYGELIEYFFGGDVELDKIAEEIKSESLSATPTVEDKSITPEVAEPRTPEEPAAERGAPDLQSGPERKYWLWSIAVGLVFLIGVVVFVLLKRLGYTSHKE